MPVRLKLVLIAAAVPVLFYWHYSNSQKAEDCTETSLILRKVGVFDHFRPISRHFEAFFLDPTFVRGLKTLQEPPEELPEPESDGEEKAKERRRW